MKKILLGLAVVAMAAGTSAYTSTAQQSYTFYNVSTNPNSTNVMDYEYQPDASCDATSLRNCSVTESLGTEPVVGAHPSSINEPISKGEYIAP